MKTVAITGRSGCGKSTVAEYYRNRGFPVLDGDAIAREVTQPGSPCLPALAAAFGADILDEAGRLRRGLLARRAFATKEDARRLTDITHPEIVRRLLAGVAKAKAAGAALVFVDGAVIVGRALRAILRCHYCGAQRRSMCWSSALCSATAFLWRRRGRGWALSLRRKSWMLRPLIFWKMKKASKPCLLRPRLCWKTF